ncbi:hypothetical protein AB4Y45_34205 [Paraburkholderia sp. EG287A]|uniref:hypothetical protein n=1 Tax=Paraburkholderia sp. EG287A TaxID=3237012 RepID=UPI0034D1A413
MKHFSHIYDVCRAALAGDTAMSTLAVKHLREALAASGCTEDADDAVLLARLVSERTRKRRKPVVHFVASAEPTAPAARSRKDSRNTTIGAQQ